MGRTPQRSAKGKHLDTGLLIAANHERLQKRKPPFREKGYDMLGWVGDIRKISLDNANFRTVAFTGKHTQLTLMRLGPGEEIGWEAHSHLDQFLRLELGKARVEFGRSGDQIDETHEIEDGWALIVPAGTWHNVVNTGTGDVRLYSLYSPPEHPAGTVQRTKAEADAAEHSSK